MKRKGIFITSVGLICISSGCIILGGHYYLNNKMTKQIADNIEKSTIYVEKRDSIDYSIKDDGDSTLVVIDETIDELDADQEVEEVKSYVNVIKVPQLNIKAYVNEGDSKASLAGGLGHHKKTAKIGEAGNCVIAGHASATYNCIFNDLYKIDILDTFLAYDENGTVHTYYVCDKYVCDPENTNILWNSGEGISTITLYTCTNKGTQRLIVVGKEFNDEELAQFKKDLNNKYLSAMSDFNNGFNVEQVSTVFARRLVPELRHYNYDYIDLFDKSINTVFKGLNGVVISDSHLSNKHQYDSSYRVNIGFSLDEYEGGSSDDTTEN